MLIRWVSSIAQSALSVGVLWSHMGHTEDIILPQWLLLAGGHMTKFR